MGGLFEDLLRIDGVKAVMFFTLSGQPLFEEVTMAHKASACASDWFALAASLEKANEAELVFEKGRVYVRRSAKGILLVSMGLIAPTGMVRLTSDIILARLKEPRPVRGIKRFFKR
jgi:hypothetical protein